jgi:hypothetical protein
MTYKIGTVGQPWGKEEKAQWFACQTIQRSYSQIVLPQIDELKQQFDVVQYGALTYPAAIYPLFAVRTSMQAELPTVLITGGVHGYETSGVLGALRFCQTKMAQYSEHFNLVVVPCVSPWGFETINRWNPNAVDPNRSFFPNNVGSTIDVQESGLLQTFVASLSDGLYAHFDLHETTDTDNSEFRPALAARDAIEQKSWNIPDGFYGVGDSLQPQDEFQAAIISSVEQVTHIAPADDDGKLIGTELAQRGVINYPTKKLGLCAGMTNAEFVTTTEVYPDSDKVDDENCILAQVAAITGGLDYLLSKR